MELSRSLLKDFATLTNGDTIPKIPNTLRGTVGGGGDNRYVILDGSTARTPISEVIGVQAGDRVLVSIENHNATIVGNLSNPPSAHREREAFTRISDVSAENEVRMKDIGNRISNDINDKITSMNRATETRISNLNDYMDRIESKTDDKLKDFNSNIETKFVEVDKKITNTIELTDEKIKLFGDNLSRNGGLSNEQIQALKDEMEITKQELEAKASLATIKEWREAYDKFVAANEAEQKQAEQDLISLTNRVQVVQANLGNMSAVWNTIDKYMRFGNEGLSIGQASSDSQILISENRISMFSAGQEVMYISQGVIHIDNGVFTKSLQIGYYVESQYENNEKINVVRYVGPK